MKAGAQRGLVGLDAGQVAAPGGPAPGFDRGQGGLEIADTMRQPGIELKALDLGIDIGIDRDAGKDQRLRDRIEVRFAGDEDDGLVDEVVDVAGMPDRVELEVEAAIEQVALAEACPDLELLGFLGLEVGRGHELVDHDLTRPQRHDEMHAVDEQLSQAGRAKSLGVLGPQVHRVDRLPTQRNAR